METRELEDFLNDLGLTDGETKVYLALLTTGESKVGPIIKKSEVSRSKVYDILERLISKNVVSKTTKDGILYYQALPSSSLNNIVKEKEEQIKYKKQLLKKIIPQIDDIAVKSDVDIMVYHGYEGFKSMRDKALKEITKKDEFLALGVSKTTEQLRNYARLIYDRQPKIKFKARSIFDSLGSYKIKERKNSLHRMRVLPKGWQLPVVLTVYADTSAIHIGKKESIVSVVIKNKDIADSYRATFELMWKISKQA